jgi:hypothetical protein
MYIINWATTAKQTIRQQPLLGKTFLNTQQYRSHHYGTYACKNVRTVVNDVFCTVRAEAIRWEAASFVEIWLVSQLVKRFCDSGTWSVQETRERGTFAVGSRHQKTGDDRDERQNCVTVNCKM